MTEAKVRFNPGHLYELRQIGILDKDEFSIYPGELIARALQKDRKVIVKVFENLQMEVGNKSQNILNFDLYTDWANETITDIRLNGVTPERLEGLEEGVTRMGDAIYWAVVQIPLIEQCSVFLFSEVSAKKPLSKKDKVKVKKMIAYTQDLRKRTGDIMTEKGEEYIKAYEDSKKELLARGGTAPDILDI